MAQFCRYCDHMLCGGSSCMGYCEVKNRLYTPEHLAHTNDCEHFAYNPIDALRRNPKGHVPRDAPAEPGHVPRDAPAEPGRDENQTVIWDFLGDENEKQGT